MDGHVYRAVPGMPARAVAPHSIVGRSVTPQNSPYMEAGVAGPQYSGYWLGGPTSQAQMAQYAQAKTPVYSVAPKAAPVQYTVPVQQQYMADCYRQYVLPNERPNSASQHAPYYLPISPSGAHPMQRQYSYPVDGAYASPKTGHYFYPSGQSCYLPADDGYGYQAAASSNRWSRFAYSNPFAASFDPSMNGSRFLMSLASSGHREAFQPAVIQRHSRQGMSTVTSVQRLSQASRVSDGVPIANHQLSYVMEGNSGYLYKSQIAADARPGSPSPASSRRRPRARQRGTSRAARRAQRNNLLRDATQKKPQQEVQQHDKPAEQQTDVTQNVLPEKSAEELVPQRPPPAVTDEIKDKLPDEPSVSTANSSFARSNDDSQEEQAEKPMEELPKEVLSKSAVERSVKSAKDEKVDPSEETPKIVQEEKSVKVTEYSNEPSANNLPDEKVTKDQPEKTQPREQVPKKQISTDNLKVEAPFQHTKGRTRKGPKDSRIVRGPRLQHKYIPWWVYFALDNFPQVFRSVVDYYFDKMHWPRLEDQPVNFQEECVTQGVSRDLRQTNRGFAPAWVFVLRRLCDERIVDKFLFPHLLGIFFEHGEFPCVDTLPLEAREMCYQLELAEDDFYAVDV